MMPAYLTAVSNIIQRAVTDHAERPARNTPVEKFMDLFNANTQPAPMRRTGRMLTTERHGQVIIDITDRTDFMPRGRDHLFIDQFAAETPGRGDGQAAMSLMTEWADKAKVHLGIFARPVAHPTLNHKAMNEEKLVDWLTAGHGFEQYHMPGCGDNLYWREPR